MAAFKLACWNVNSIRARQERALNWLATHSPDVLCLQELKVEDGTFPHEVFAEAGYVAATHGQKTYNGVAVLARQEPSDVRTTLEDDVGDPQARIINVSLADLRVICVYVPNGGEVGSEKWEYKLAWLERLEAYIRREVETCERLVLCGDFNIAPDDQDVAQPDMWSSSVLCHPDVRQRLEAIRSHGLVDLFRQQEPDGGVYSWWDYRRLAFPKNDGLRIDLIYGSDAVAKSCTAAWVDRDERKGKQPSDHAPVVVEFG